MIPFSLQDLTVREIGLVLLLAIAVAGAIYAIMVGVSRLMFARRLRELEIAMARYPSYADVRAQLASLYYSYGYVKKAKQYYYEALKIYPFYLYARLKLALLSLEHQCPDEALYHFRRIRIDAEQDPTMVQLVEGLLREKGLIAEYLKDPSPEDTDEFFARRLLVR